MLMDEMNYLVRFGKVYQGTRKSYLVSRSIAHRVPCVFAYVAGSSIRRACCDVVAVMYHISNTEARRYLYIEYRLTERTLYEPAVGAANDQ